MLCWDPMIASNGLAIVASNDFACVVAWLFTGCTTFCKIYKIVPSQRSGMEAVFNGPR